MPKNKCRCRPFIFCKEVTRGNMQKKKHDVKPPNH